MNFLSGISLYSMLPIRSCECERSASARGTNHFFRPVARGGCDGCMHPPGTKKVRIFNNCLICIFYIHLILYRKDIDELYFLNLSRPIARGGGGAMGAMYAPPPRDQKVHIFNNCIIFIHCV